MGLALRLADDDLFPDRIDNALLRFERRGAYVLTLKAYLFHRIRCYSLAAASCKWPFEVVQTRETRNLRQKRTDLSIRLKDMSSMWNVGLSKSVASQTPLLANILISLLAGSFGTFESVA